MPYHVDRDQELIKNIKEGLREDRGRRSQRTIDGRVSELGAEAKEALESIDAIARRPHKDSASLLQRRLDEIAAVTKVLLRKYRI